MLKSITLCLKNIRPKIYSCYNIIKQIIGGPQDVSDLSIKSNSCLFSYISVSVGRIPGSILDGLRALLVDLLEVRHSGFHVEVRVFWGALMLVF